MQKYKYEGLAIEQAMLSKSKQRLGAVLVSGNNVWMGHNDMFRTHPIGRYLFENKWIQVGVHAEMEVLIASKGRAEGATLYVARVKRDGFLGLAMPCRRCKYLIEKAGIRKVYYTVESNYSDWVMEFPYTWST
jgi:deoxycytidylate deaminase